MRHATLLLLLLLVPSSGFAAKQTVKVRGVIGRCGTSECGIGGLSRGYSFVPHTKIANAILSVCGIETDCEIDGVVDDKYYFISVSNVRRVDVDIEPSTDVFIQASSWLFSLGQDNDTNRFSMWHVNMHKLSKYKNNVGIMVWCARMSVVGFRDKELVDIGPDEVYVFKQQGEWHFSRTKP
ncbi:hypothetical protein [Fundidesulfovibrio magnetotacticus]|uniref:hypothetical protein n=1 Tax=Fundidesulfovibrio magnetotacticus TaxID=2730080 RepID=UPI001563B047|nr:hypothetical protein [Fundidesulfovibrio magnetotacticus]